jgi:uncharacterized membrane protein YdjX (TVP38/TMEM64 family)
VSLFQSSKAKLLPALIALALLGLLIWQSLADPQGLTSAFESWIAVHRLLGALAYFGLVAASVVLLPFSSLPLLPVAAHAYGVWITAFLSAAGWWVGALIAFGVARAGRPWLERVTSLEAVDRLEQRIPRDVGFGAIVVLRMLLPVDLVSFALGLLKGLSFRLYAIASLAGIAPFALLWSYAGGELAAGRFWTFAAALAVITIAVVAGRRLWKRRR